jgi:hypothetical protein
MPAPFQYGLNNRFLSEESIRFDFDSNDFHNEALVSLKQNIAFLVVAQ